MPTFLGFLKNTVTGEEFVAPVEAPERARAEAGLRDQYPAAAYAILTVYEQREMERVMDGVRRWPGLASKVQPKLEDLFANVSVARALPPLHGRAPTKLNATQARLEQVRTMARGTHKGVQELVARLLAADLQGDIRSAKPDSHARMETVSDARPKAKVPAAPAIPPVAMAPLPAPAARQAAQAERPSLITMLKQMKQA
ncbi:MAG: hypothetical protein GC129_01305 [Proteobacteria bacterium]|nr:hypothetical protein [Pseudomonadota bacterium]